MKVLKILGTILLGWLLFLSLVFLDVALMVHGTLLSPDFVVERVEQTDLAVLTRDVVETEAGDQLTPEEDFILKAVYQAIDDLEPQIKARLTGAIRTGYDYFLGKSDRLDITIPLADLKQGFQESLWQTFTSDPATWLPIFQDDLNAYVDQNFIALAQQFRQSLPAPLNLLPVEALRQPLQDYLLQIEAQIIEGDLPPETYDMILTIARPYYDDLFNQMTVDIPDDFTIDSETLPADTASALEQVRLGIGYFRSGFYGLIILAFLLAAGIVLLNFSIRGACLALGIVLTAGGAADLAGVLVAGSAIPPNIPAEVPASLGLLLNGMIMDILAVGRFFAIALLAFGVVLLAVSLLYRRENVLE